MKVTKLLSLSLKGVDWVGRIFVLIFIISFVLAIKNQLPINWNRTVQEFFGQIKNDEKNIIYQGNKPVARMLFEPVYEDDPLLIRVRFKSCLLSPFRADQPIKIRGEEYELTNIPVITGFKSYGGVRTCTENSLSEITAVRFLLQ